MSTPDTAGLAAVDTLDTLYPQLDKAGFGAGWNKPTPSLWASPKKSFVPTKWSYAYGKEALRIAGGLISTEQAERRNLILFNPAEGNTYGTTRTIVAAYQMIMPNEWARSHRHTPNALRLILDTEPGTYTIVNGVKIAMEPGDVLLTPNWSTHGHGNTGSSPGYWVDFLDAPLVQLLEPMFFDPHLEDDNHEAFDSSDPGTTDSAFVFTYKDTVKRLAEAKADPSGRHARRIQLGEPALDTVALYMMGLDAGQKTAPFQTTANNIYAVVEGEGKTIADGETFTWTRGDVVCVPAWRSHHHEASKDSILFRVTDEPTLSRLGFLREGQA